MSLRLKRIFLLALLLSGCVTSKLQKYIENDGIYQQYRIKNVLSKKSQTDIDLCFLFENRSDGAIKAARITMPNQPGAAGLQKQDIVMQKDGCGSEYTELENIYLPHIKQEEICKVEFGVFGGRRTDAEVEVYACQQDQAGRSSLRVVDAKLGQFEGMVSGGKKTYLYALYPFTLATDAVLVVTLVAATVVLDRNGMRPHGRYTASNNSSVFADIQFGGGNKTFEIPPAKEPAVANKPK